MTFIKGAHDLADAPNPAAPAAGNGRSRYCYLFPTMADDLMAGIFEGTDEEGTILRLKDFVEATLPPFIPPAAEFMQLPAAYTYFGQFMNHDLSAPVREFGINDGPTGIIGTADLAGLTKIARKDTETILDHFLNEHSDPLTLGSLYGDGPGSDDKDVANLYQADKKRFVTAITSTPSPESLAKAPGGPDSVFRARLAADIPRKEGIPLIADQRNDGNLILSQLHLAFMLVHNKAVTALESLNPKPTDCFCEARRLVLLHYHWLILHDFLPSLLSKTVVSKPLSQWATREIEAKKVPMEFTTAAFRFGHSMVGRTYDYNANFGRGGKISEEGALLLQLFNFTSHGKMERPSEEPAIQLPDHWVIDWDRMTKATAAGIGDPENRAEQIDLKFAPDMLNIAGAANVRGHGSIMFRNLLRGFHRRMPFGQDLAFACDVPKLEVGQIRLAMKLDPTADKADVDAVADAAEALGILKETPAWLYFLCEAKILEFGERVGPTASQIIAETIVGLMRHNPESVLCHDGGTWEPGRSVLKTSDDKPLNSLRAFLMFATEPEPG